MLRCYCQIDRASARDLSPAEAAPVRPTSRHPREARGEIAIPARQPVSWELGLLAEHSAYSASRAPRLQPEPAFQHVRLAHQPEAEIARRDAGRAATGPRVADEVGHIAAVLAFDDAHAAIDRGCRRIVERSAREAGAGPLPDVAGKVDEPMLVHPEAAER